MKIFIRTDASVRIGSGHVMRCLTLAAELRRRGAEVKFISRQHPGHLIEGITREGHPVCGLPASRNTGFASDADYAAWLGVTEAVDAGETLACIGDSVPNWLAVDHYGLGIEWERMLRPAVGGIFAIDDIAREHGCDILLDQNWFGEETSGRYTGRVPQTCRLLLGPRYALLQPEYAHLRETLRPRDGCVGRVLVYFGASDPTNQTSKALEALCTPEFAPIAVDVVLGANHPDAADIEALAAKRPGTKVHRNVPTLAALMGSADLAIGAGGSTTWERMCMGISSVVVSVADNQVGSCAALAHCGLVDYIGPASATDVADLAAHLRKAVNEPKRLRLQGGAARMLVDGLGVVRVCDALQEARTPGIDRAAATSN